MRLGRKSKVAKNSLQPFRFKQFEVYQDQCAMKVGTDGVLLGGWASHSSPTRILDIGTGTGLIALMLAQRFSGAFIEAVEVDDKAAVQAGENFKGSSFSDRLRVCHSSIQNFEREEKYDLIVSNPPFFSNSLVNPDNQKEIARHQSTLLVDELFAVVAKRLSENGVFCLVWPSSQSEGVEEVAQALGLHCIEECTVESYPGGPRKRTLLKFAKALREKERSVFTIHSEKGKQPYSAAFKSLLKEFYLEF